ncbi:MAG: pinensin family lanthipeptide [Thermoanaerobaculia bacterium]|nr:pinensin family lanthipeptide [Thermoanaerobaculia bacterium]
MAKKKITLTDLKVQSLVTTLDEAQMNHVKGGIYIVRGRRFAYRTRWTSVDTRSDEVEMADPIRNKPF